jgi:two-component system, chemotaxis family, chemotaxis protein CheY
MPPTPADSTSPRILLVGHCRPDAWLLKGAVERAIPDADIVMVSSSADLDRELEAAHLLLVNRVMDGYFEHSLGQALIRALKPRLGARASLILVSNLPDAQAEAVAAGALPGFGKSDLHSDDTRQRLRTAIELAQRARAPNP